MTTPTPRWSAETEELVARAEYTTDMTTEESDDFEPIEWTQVLPFVREAYLERARAGLTALADAGVLTPVGGETRQECGRHLPMDRVTGACHGPDLLCTLPSHHRHRTITTYPDGTELTTPWREVTDGGE